MSTEQYSEELALYKQMAQAILEELTDLEGVKFIYRGVKALQEYQMAEQQEAVA